MQAYASRCKPMQADASLMQADASRCKPMQAKKAEAEGAEGGRKQREQGGKPKGAKSKALAVISRGLVLCRGFSAKAFLRFWLTPLLPLLFSPSLYPSASAFCGCITARILLAPAFIGSHSAFITACILLA